MKKKVIIIGGTVVIIAVLVAGALSFHNSDKVNTDNVVTFSTPTPVVAFTEGDTSTVTPTVLPTISIAENTSEETDYTPEEIAKYNSMASELAIYPWMDTSIENINLNATGYDAIKSGRVNQTVPGEYTKKTTGKYEVHYEELTQNYNADNIAIGAIQDGFPLDDYADFDAIYAKYSDRFGEGLTEETAFASISLVWWIWYYIEQYCEDTGDTTSNFTMWEEDEWVNTLPCVAENIVHTDQGFVIHFLADSASDKVVYEIISDEDYYRYINPDAINHQPQ